MTPDQIITANDALRCEFKGGTVLMTPAVRTLSADLRAAAFSYMRHCSFFPRNSLHDAGAFALGHLTFIWHIGTFAGCRSLTLSLSHEWAGVPLPWEHPAESVR